MGLPGQLSAGYFRSGQCSRHCSSGSSSSRSSSNSSGSSSEISSEIIRDGPIWLVDALLLNDLCYTILRAIRDVSMTRLDSLQHIG